MRKTTQRGVPIPHPQIKIKTLNGPQSVALLFFYHFMPYYSYPTQRRLCGWNSLPTSKLNRLSGVVTDDCVNEQLDRHVTKSESNPWGEKNNERKGGKIYIVGNVQDRQGLLNK